MEFSRPESVATGDSQESISIRYVRLRSAMLELLGHLSQLKEVNSSLRQRNAELQAEIQQRSDNGPKETSGEHSAPGDSLRRVELEQQCKNLEVQSQQLSLLYSTRLESDEPDEGKIQQLRAECASLSKEVQRVEADVERLRLDNELLVSRGQGRAQLKEQLHEFRRQRDEYPDRAGAENLIKRCQDLRTEIVQARQAQEFLQIQRHLTQIEEEIGLQCQRYQSLEQAARESGIDLDFIQDSLPADLTDVSYQLELTEAACQQAQTEFRDRSALQIQNQELLENLLIRKGQQALEMQRIKQACQKAELDLREHRSRRELLLDELARKNELRQQVELEVERLLPQVSNLRDSRKATQSLQNPTQEGSAKARQVEDKRSLLARFHERTRYCQNKIADLQGQLQEVQQIRFQLEKAERDQNLGVILEGSAFDD